MSSSQTAPLSGGPYVTQALFCERVLREVDGVMSVIRVIDRITHTERGPNPPSDMPEVNYPLTLVISLKSGRARGRHQITIVPEQPSGETLQPISVSINFEGEGRGANIVTGINLPFRIEGLYWFNVSCDENLLTRIPLEVQYARLVAGSATPDPQS